jgi:hypothetical protein
MLWTAMLLLTTRLLLRNFLECDTPDFVAYQMDSPYRGRVHA